MTACVTWAIIEAMDRRKDLAVLEYFTADGIVSLTVHLEPGEDPPRRPSDAPPWSAWRVSRLLGNGGRKS